MHRRNFRNRARAQRAEGLAVSRVPREVVWSTRRESNPRPCSREKGDGGRLPLLRLDSQPIPLPLRVLWSCRCLGDKPETVSEQALRPLALTRTYPAAMYSGRPSSLLALLAYPEDAHSRPAPPPPVAETCPSPSPLAATGPATPSARSIPRVSFDAAPRGAAFTRITLGRISGSARRERRPRLDGPTASAPTAA